MKTEGPGKYDDLCTHVRVEADALVAIVVVIDGNNGSGFSVQSVGDKSVMSMLPGLLETMAADIRKQSRQ